MIQQSHICASIQRIESRVLQRYLYSPVYSSQKAEATKMFINGWVNKQNVIYVHNGILLGFKKEGNCDTCYNINEL